jgi:glycosyltransferase involved in cell wall biosynthesis
MNGINVIGFTSANFGLAVAARNTVQLLLDKGYDVSVADLQLDGGRSSQDHTFDRLMHTGGGALPHAINLFHLNPPHFGALLQSGPSWLVLENRLNVCVPFWEQTVLPASWAAPLSAMDAVLCPSRFIERAVAASCQGPLPHVRHYPQTAFLPADHGPDRAKFGLPEQGVLFVQSFEMGSDCDRKNPWGAIDAFTRAFTQEDDAYLIVKLNNSAAAAGSGPALARLREYSIVNNKIIVFDRNLGYEEVLSLYESCDCLVSLHRSEGLGLGPMEAMLLGKPVLATAWSGNMDFMDDGNSCLVDYTLVPVESPLYRRLAEGKTMQWAEPDLAQAAVWMRRLYKNAALRNNIGAAARESMVRRREECGKSDVFTGLEEMLFRKRYRASMNNASSVPIGSFAADDPSLFFRVIAKLLKENNTAGAFDLYHRNRDCFRETPELLRIDEIMRRIKVIKQ